MRTTMWIPPYLSFNLLRELSGRRQDQANRPVPWPKRGLVEAVLHHGDAEAGGFARTGLGTAENVTPAESDRDSLRLDGRGLLILVNCDVGIDVRVQILGDDTREISLER